MKPQRRVWQASAVVAFLLALAWSAACQATAQAVTPAAPCLVPVYLIKDECGKAMSHKCMVWENRYILNVLLGELPSHGCRALLLDRVGAEKAIERLATLEAPAMVLVARWGMKQGEVQAVTRMSNYTRQKLVVIHTGDEKKMKPHATDWYPLVKAVFRNYHLDNATVLRAWASYLTQPLAPAVTQRPDDSPVLAEGQQPGMAGEQPAANVFWIPLGFGETFVAAEVAVLPFALKPILWSWVGSTHGKWERSDMVTALREPSASTQGVLIQLDTFKAGNMLSPLRYTDMLLQSKLVPVPKGVSCEQFRLWEAFIAGAIPVAWSGHKEDGLAHIVLLGFKMVWVESWTDAPALFNNVQTNTTLQAELAAWQAFNWQRYREVMHRVSIQVAHVVSNSSA